ncbi:EF-P 5-aminopentanol modification-associated protein YfmF [Radiobacillus sp. PE A8.2]|uniref:EF-P 5-aminopentanol modification-associated protein YfmF n=1 Tax=Radiobacillus sp. PE A8.2 TaxID=3380349 RepID=UPI00388D8219
MQMVKEQKITSKGFQLHVVPTKKFKTIHVVARFKSSLSRDTITKRALIPYILQQGTKNYPTARELQTALDQLYGAIFNIDAAKKGDNHILTFRMEIANQAFLTSHEPILDKALDLLHEIIFNPKTSNGAFDESILKREKQTLKHKMDSIIDDKMSFANMRLIDEMCTDEAYSLHVHGYPDDLEAITSQQLYSYYQELLHQDQMDVYIVGDLDGLDVENMMESCFSREVSDNEQTVEVSIKPAIKNVNEVVERQQLQQAKLHIGYRTNITYTDEAYPGLQVFNGIFGGFPSSKLFMNVREKHSLAYYAASRIESHKGLLFVFSGIAPDKFNDAKEIILEQMDRMKQGDFSEEQVEEAKQIIVNQLKETLDHPFGIVELLYHQVLAGSNSSPDDLIEKVKQVTKDDLLQIGKKIELDTIYFLTSQGGTENE